MRRKGAVIIASVALTLATAAPALATVVNVGGGTWNYGTSYSFPSTKKVWSHYVHPSQYHSATAVAGSNNVKVYANAGSWANADTQCAVNQGSAEYWNTY